MVIAADIMDMFSRNFLWKSKFEPFESKTARKKTEFDMR